MKSLLKSGVAAGAIIVMAGFASAQTPPVALSGIEGLTFKGEMLGDSVWAPPGGEYYFLVSPDGLNIATVMRPVSRPSSQSPSMNEAAASGETFLAVEDDNVQVPLSAPFRGFGSMGSADACSSPVSGSLVDLSSGQGPILETSSEGISSTSGGSQVPASTLSPVAGIDLSGRLNGTDIARSSEAALQGFNAEERRALLLDLVNGLRSANSQEEFIQGILDWRLLIDQRRSEKGLPAYFTEDGSEPAEQSFRITPEPVLQAEELSVEDQSGEITVTNLEAPSVTVSEIEPGTGDISLEQQLLNDARENSLWFSLGSLDAPTVYAFIDPTCPFCARAIAVLAEPISRKELQLRIILAPVVSSRAPAVIAGIFEAEDPTMAFLDHELDTFHSNRSNLALGNFDALPGPIRAGVQRNVNMIRDYQIPGVPFFVYETEDGARAFSGIPDGISFDGALNDPYMGRR